MKKLLKRGKTSLKSLHIQWYKYSRINTFQTTDLTLLLVMFLSKLVFHSENGIQAELNKSKQTKKKQNRCLLSTLRNCSEMWIFKKRTEFLRVSAKHNIKNI